MADNRCPLDLDPRQSDCSQPPTPPALNRDTPALKSVCFEKRKDLVRPRPLRCRGLISELSELLSNSANCTAE